MPHAWIGIGSNLGDRLGALRAAVAGLEAAGVRVRARSPIYATLPVGPVPEQPEFLNAVVEVETELEPEPLLACCLAVEAALGRRRDVVQGPRVVDLDLLLYDDRVLDGPRLVLPHPRLHEREFVLRPLLDVAPGAVDPRDGRRLAARLRAVAGQGVRPAGLPW